MCKIASTLNSLRAVERRMSRTVRSIKRDRYFNLKSQSLAKNWKPKLIMNNKPLRKAVKDQDIKAVRALLIAGIDVNTKEAVYGNTLLHIAVSHRNKELVELLLNVKADVHLKNHEGSTAYQWALDRNDLNIARMLVRAGADVNSKSSKSGRTALHLATAENKVELTKYLLSNGADVHLRDNSDRTALQDTVNRCNLEIAKILIEAGADVNTKTRTGKSTLHLAANVNDIVLVQFLLSRGACVNEKDDLELTPLHYACWNFYSTNLITKLIEYLLEHGADVNALDRNNSTPLMCMLKNAHSGNMDQGNFNIPVSILKLLLPYSDVNVIDSSERNIFTICSSKYLRKIITEHLAIWKVLDLPIRESILDSVMDDDQCNDYFEQCTEELLVAKGTRLENSWVTFLNFLVDDRRKLKNYAGNKELVDSFKKSNCLSKFPIYGAAMQENVTNGIFRRELFDKSAVLLSDKCPIFDPDHLIIRDVLDCLDDEYLSKLSTGYGIHDSIHRSNSVLKFIYKKFNSLFRVKK